MNFLPVSAASAYEMMRSKEFPIHRTKNFEGFSCYQIMHGGVNRSAINYVTESQAIATTIWMGMRTYYKSSDFSNFLWMMQTRTRHPYTCFYSRKVHSDSKEMTQLSLSHSLSCYANMQNYTEENFTSNIFPPVGWSARWKSHSRTVPKSRPENHDPIPKLPGTMTQTQLMLNYKDAVRVCAR